MTDPKGKKKKKSLADTILGESANISFDPTQPVSLADKILGNTPEPPSFQNQFLNQITNLNKAKVNPVKNDQVESTYEELSKEIAKRYELDEDDARDFVSINAQKDFSLSGYDLKTDLDQDAEEQNLSFNQLLLQQSAPQADATIRIPSPAIGNEDALLKVNGFNSFDELYEQAEEVKLGPGLEAVDYNLDQEIEEFKDRKGRGQAALDAFQQSSKELYLGLSDLLVEAREKGRDFSEYIGGLTSEEVEQKRQENLEFKEEIAEKRTQNIEENQNTEYEQYATNKLASAVPSFIPMVAGAAVSRVSPATGANIMRYGFGLLSGSSAGSAMREYEEYQKSLDREVDDLDKWSVGVGSAGVEYITERLPMSKFLGRSVRKNLASGALKTRVKLSPQDNLDLGKDILRSYAKKQPSNYKKFVSEIKDIGREGSGESAAELLQAAISNYYKDNKDQLKGDQLFRNMADAFFIGSAMRSGISPLSYNNQDRAIQQRRNAQGGVVLTEYNGEAVEIISRKEKDGKIEYTAMYPDGEVLEVDADKAGELFKLSNEQFQNLLRAKGEEKTAYEAIRTEQQFQTKTQIDEKFDTDEAKQVNEQGVEVFREGLVRDKETDQIRPVTVVNTNGKQATVRYEDTGEKNFVNIRDVEDLKEFNRDDFYKLYEVDYIPNTPFKSPSSGEKIVHPTFGEGEIVAYDPNNGNATVKFTDNSDPSDPQPIIETDVPRATIDQYRGLYDELKTQSAPIEKPTAVQQEEVEEIDPFNDKGEIDLNPKRDEKDSGQLRRSEGRDDRGVEEPSAEGGNNRENTQDSRESINEGSEDRGKREVDEPSSQEAQTDIEEEAQNLTDQIEQEGGAVVQTTQQTTVSGTDSAIPESTERVQGWVVVDKNTGNAVLELNQDQKNVADAINKDQFDVVPAQEYQQTKSNQDVENKNQSEVQEEPMLEGLQDGGSQEQAGQESTQLRTEENKEIDESDTTTQEEGQEAEGEESAQERTSVQSRPVGVGRKPSSTESFQKTIIKQRPDLKGTDQTNVTSHYVNPWTQKTKGEIESEAKKVIDKLGKNKPDLEVYESDLDLIANYPQLADQIRVDERSGFFTIEGGTPKIVLIGTNPKFRDSKGNIDSREVADTVIHEMIGHYGLRGSLDALGGKKTDLFNALEEAKSGMKKDRLNTLTQRYTDNQVEQFDDLGSQNPRYYEILEEYVAHEVQLNNIDGRPKRNSVTKSIIDYIKVLLEKIGVQLPDSKLRELITNARRFVEVGENNFVPRQVASIDIDTMKQLGQLPDAFQIANVQENVNFKLDESQENQRGSEAYQESIRIPFERAYEYIIRSVGSVESQQREAAEQQAVGEYARSKNLLINYLYRLGVESDAGGVENKIALDIDQGWIYKSNNLFTHKGSVLSFIDYVQNHNALFPETSYELVGFQEIQKNKQPFYKPIVRQKFVDKTTQATQEQIDDLMAIQGFEKVNNHTFENNQFIISDLRPNNVLVNEDGLAFVVDDRIKTKIQEQASIDIQFQKTPIKIDFIPKSRLNDRQIKSQDKIKEKYKDYRKLYDCFNS